MKFRNFIDGPVTEEREFNGKSFCVTGYSRAWRKKMLDEKVREENDRIKEESFRELNGKTYKRKDCLPVSKAEYAKLYTKALSEEPKKMRLKEEYQELADDYKSYIEYHGRCQCPAGNPSCLENTEEAWEEDLDDYPGAYDHLP